MDFAPSDWAASAFPIIVEESSLPRRSGKPCVRRIAPQRLFHARSLPHGSPPPESPARMSPIPTSIDATLALLRDGGYVPDRALATVLFLSLKMGRPLFLEGEAGVGKTEIAKVLSDRLGRRL